MMNIFNLTLLSIATAMIGVGISYSKIYLYHLVLFALLSVIALKTIKAKKIVLHKPATRYHYFFFAITFWYLLSTLWSISPISSIRYFIYISLGSITSLTIIYSTPNYFRLNKLFRVITAVALLEIVICLLESYTSFRWPISPYSNISHFFGRESLLPAAFNNPSLMTQFLVTPTGFRAQQNNLGLMMLMTLPFFLFSKQLSIKIVGSLITAIVIYNTTSRALFGCMLVTILVYLLFYNMKRAVITTALVVLFVPAFYFAGDRFQQTSIKHRAKSAVRVAQLYFSSIPTTNKSILIRRSLMKNGFASIKSKPLLGVGGGGSAEVQKRKGAYEGVLSMHNFWLELAVDLGAPAAILFLLFYLWLAYSLLKISFYNKNQSYLAKSTSLSLIIFIPAVITISSSIYFLPMWILLGLSIAQINLFKKQKNKKILLLAPGSSTHTQKWACSLANKGFQIAIFTLHPLDITSSHFPEKIKIYSPYYPRHRLYPKLLRKIFYLSTLPYLYWIIWRFRPSIVHAHYASSYGLLGALTFFQPLFVSTWGSDVFSFPKKSIIHRTIIKFVLSRAHKIFATGKTLKDETQKFTLKRIEIISFGIDILTFRPQPKSRGFFSQDAIVIGSFKSLKKIYRIDDLIKSFARLKKLIAPCKINLLIVGSGDQESHLKKMTHDLNIENDVIFTGYVPHHQIPQYMNMIDICAMLSQQESFGVAALEASACEKPVVATNIGGIPEIIKHQHSGLLIPVQDDLAAADAMRELIDDSNKRSQMGKNGRVLVERHFQWAVNLDQMVQHYQ